MKKGVSPGEASRRIREEHGVSPSLNALKYHKKRGLGFGTSPARKGKAPAIPVKIEKEFVDMILFFEELGFVVTMQFAMDFLSGVIEGTPAEDKMVTERQKRRYIYRVIKKKEYDLSFGKCFVVEEDRSKWEKAYILKQHYDTVKKILLDNNYAVRNPNYDESDPTSEEIILTSKERMISFDETKVKLDQTKEHVKSIGSKKRKKKGTVTKSSMCMSAVGSTIANGDTLPVYCVWQTGTLTEGQVQGQNSSLGPVNTYAPYISTPFHTCNEKGSVRAVELLDYLKKCVIPAYPDLSAKKPVIVFMDGCVTHLKYFIIEFCVENHIILVLRPPHTTHVIQPEDVHGFGVFKHHFTEAKMKKMTELRLLKINAIANSTAYFGPTHLSKADLIDLMKDPWQIAFSNENVKLAWKKVGVSPFTRCVEKALKVKEEATAKSFSKVASNAAMSKKMQCNISNFFNGGTSKTLSNDATATSNDEMATSNSNGRKISKTAHFWNATHGAITAPAFVKGLEKEEKERLQLEVQQQKKRAKREQSLSEKVAIWKKQGAIYWQKWKINFIDGRRNGNWNNYKSWPDMKFETLKSVLAHFDVYPGQRPPRKYKYGGKMDDLFREVLDMYKEKEKDIDDEVKVIKKEKKKEELLAQVEIDNKSRRQTRGRGNGRGATKPYGGVIDLDKL